MLLVWRLGVFPQLMNLEYETLPLIPFYGCKHVRIIGGKLIFF